MMQSERDDYDDQRFDQKPQRNPSLRRRAGLLWFRTWLWFLVGVCTFFGTWYLRKFEEEWLFYLSVHLMIDAIFILGALFVREGKGILLWPITIGSILAGAFYGGFGFLIGLLILVCESDTPSVIIGCVTMICSVGFVGWGFIAIHATYQCATQKSVPINTEFQFRNSSPNVKGAH